MRNQVQVLHRRIVGRILYVNPSLERSGISTEDALINYATSEHGSKCDGCNTPSEILWEQINS